MADPEPATSAEHVYLACTPEEVERFWERRHADEAWREWKIAASKGDRP